MVVCRYYMEGSCRFGSNCKYEHPKTAENSTNTPRNVTIDLGMLVKSVQTDMLNSEKGGQWLLSSYSPFREKALFPGFEDQSFEEVRSIFYKASANGTIDQVKMQFQESLQQTMNKVRALQNPNEVAVKTIQVIYNTPSGNQVPMIQNLFGDSTFGSNIPQSTPFGSTTNGFGSTNQPFQTQNSIFGGGQIQMQQSSPTGNIFAQQPVNNAFSGGSIFGGSANMQKPETTQQQSIFSIQPSSPPQQQSIFSLQPSPPFGQMYQQNIFAQAAQQQKFFFGSATMPQVPHTQGNIFASALQNTQPQQAGIFQTAVQKAGGFPPQNIFASAASNNGAFASTPQQNTTAPRNVFEASPFQNPLGFQPTVASSFESAGVTSNIFGNVANTETINKDEFFSNANLLVASDVEAFKHDSFEIGAVPVQPPTDDMCA